MERSRTLSGARAVEALFPACGAGPTIQVLMSAIVRDDDVMGLGKGSWSSKKAASAIMIDWRWMMKVRLECGGAGQTSTVRGHSKAGTRCSP